MVDVRPRSLTIQVVFDVESESEVQNAALIHPNSQFQESDPYTNSGRSLIVLIIPFQKGPIRGGDLSKPSTVCALITLSRHIFTRPFTPRHIQLVVYTL